MTLRNINDTEQQIMTSDDMRGVVKQVAIGREEGWKDHVMRVFTLQPEGYTAKHAHPWPHINYILEGTGTLLLGDVLHPLKAGHVAYIPDQMMHQFVNTGSVPLRLICIVPERGHYK